MSLVTVVMPKTEEPLVVTFKGGAGSGHRGHAGRPGSVGGSVPSSIAMSVRTGRVAAIRAGWKPEVKKPEPPKNSRFMHGELDDDISNRDSSSITEVIRILPQEHLDMVRGISTPEWITGDPAGDCDPGGYIQLYGGAKGMRGGRMWKTSDVIHEIGHAVHFHMNKYGTERMHSKVRGVYNKLRDKSGMSRREFIRQAVAGFVKTRGFPSKYAQKNEYELFAESYTMYVRSSARLLRMSPNMYSLMRDKVFGGVEYTT